MRALLPVFTVSHGACSIRHIPDVEGELTEETQSAPQWTADGPLIAWDAASSCVSYWLLM